MVNLKSVTVTHKNGTTALKRVSLRIDDGEFVLINGHSGAGKSTIVRLLTAEDVPTSGEVVIDGVNTKNLTHRQIPKFRRRLDVYKRQILYHTPPRFAIDEVEIFSNIV